MNASVETVQPSDLRQFAGHFPTGVAVVTTRDLQGKSYGVTINAVTSLSLTPPLLLICLDKCSNTLAAIAESGTFCLHYLEANQSHVSRVFASKSDDKFAEIASRLSEAGNPILDGVLAASECRVTETYPGGDHTIVVGMVERIQMGGGEPLLYHRGGYACLDNRVGARDALTGVARIGVAELVAVTWLPELVASLRRDYPGLTLELDVSLTASLFARLMEGELDAVLIPGGRFDNTNLVASTLGFTRFAWMASPRLELPQGPITPPDLTKHPILSLGEGSYHYGPAEEWLAAHGGSRRRVDVCNSMSVIASLTQAGLGVSLLPPGCFQSEVAEGQLCVLDTRPEMPEVEFSAVHMKRQPSVIPEAVAKAARQASSFQTRSEPTQDASLAA